MGVAENKLMVVGNWALIKKGKKILLLKRNEKEVLGADSWSVPGGKSEKGSDCYSNLDREVKEEAGIEIKNIRFLIHESWSRLDDWVMGFFWLADYNKGKVKVNHEHSDFGWFSKEDFKKIKTTKLMEKIINKAFLIINKSPKKRVNKKI